MFTKKKYSLNVKTLMYLIFFNVFLLLFLWIVQIGYLSYTYEKQTSKILNKMANSIHQATQDSIVNNLETIASEYNVCIEFYSTYGEMYTYNTKKNTCILGKNNAAVLRYEQAFINSNEEMKAIRLVDENIKTKSLLYGIKIENGYVFLYTALEDISVASTILKGQLIYITAFAILFACALSYFLSRKITKPISDITKKAKSLGEGKLDIVFTKNGIKEIDDLVDTLNQAQEELTKNDELRRDLMSNVSHDLKTPLTMIQAYAEMVKDISYKNKKKREEHLDIIIAESKRLTNLVNDILSLSQLQAKEQEIHKESYDLIASIKEILKRYDIMQETEEYKFILDAPEQAFILADQNKLDQVLYNLINNAINYTGEDKTVTVRVSDKQERFLIEIIDTGKGIAKDEIPRIWEKYYKNEKNHQRNVVGTGIGLSIVKTILTNHHFEYGVKSKRNKGTTFYFYADKSSTKNSVK